MAQLNDDCFAFGGELMLIEDAIDRMTGQVPTISGVETVPLREANGRVVVNDVVARISIPSFDNSAVDGYAVRHSDIAMEGEIRLRVVDRVTAGRPAMRPIAAGEAVRIFTGAPMPPGTDTVYMQEDCRSEERAVIVPAGLRRGANRRLAGEDIRAGAIAVRSGRCLSPADVALAAAIGCDKLEVRRRVRVALFSTGDEVVEPGKALPPAGIYDANRYLLLGLLQRLGVETHDLGILADDTDTLVKSIGGAAVDHDLVLTSGGVSTGEADHVKAAVEKLGRLVFWRLAIKPGRPVAMGVIGGNAFVGLPGNPVAVFVTFVRVVRPLIMRLAGAEPRPIVPLPVRAAFSYRKKKGRREYVRVRLQHAADGVLEAIKHAQEGAGAITSLTETDGLAELMESTTTVEQGSTVGFLPYPVLS